MEANPEQCVNTLTSQNTFPAANALMKLVLENTISSGLLEDLASLKAVDQLPSFHNSVQTRVSWGSLFESDNKKDALFLSFFENCSSSS